MHRGPLLTSHRAMGTAEWLYKGSIEETYRFRELNQRAGRHAQAVGQSSSAGIVPDDDEAAASPRVSGAARSAPLAR